MHHRRRQDRRLPAFMLSARARRLADAKARATHYFETTSDAFFANETAFLEQHGIDVARIDGLHSYRQVVRDVENTLRYLRDDGVIVLHDRNLGTPRSPAPRRRTPTFVRSTAGGTSSRSARPLWSGDVWKAIVHLRSTRHDLRITVLNCDVGVGLYERDFRESRLSCSAAQIEVLNYADLAATATVRSTVTCRVSRRISRVRAPNLPEVLNKWLDCPESPRIPARPPSRPCLTTATPWAAGRLLLRRRAVHRRPHQGPLDRVWQREYTHALIGDLEREGAEYRAVYNRGDYPKISNERVIAPGENLGRLGGSDVGFRLAFSQGYSPAMTLTSDTSILEGICRRPARPRAYPLMPGSLGRCSTRGCQARKLTRNPTPQTTLFDRFIGVVPAVAGTALVLSCECWQMIGGWDLRTVGCYGWAIDFDLALRARAAGYGLYTTEMAYINHFGRKTGNARFGSWRDEWAEDWQRTGDAQGIWP